MKLSAVLLAGGKGTRISALFPDVPKPMITVAEKPFMEWVIRHLAGEGVNHFVVSLGHLAHVAEGYFAQRPADGLTIVTVREQQPLGTGGGFMMAQEAAPEHDTLLVTNGDSLVLTPLTPVWRLLARPEVDGAIVGVKMDDVSRYGSLDVAPDGRLVGFREKQPGQGLINAGIYVFKRRLLSLFPPQRPLSFESEVFPALLKAGAHLAVHACEAPFLDIGTPETVRVAEAFITDHFRQVKDS